MTAQQAAAPIDYSDGSTWLCRPGRQDACAVDQASTTVRADGTLTREAWSADPAAPIDCFYVYPTVSSDQGPNSDMNPNEPELRVIDQQFARFASVCRPYAPSYRQVTLQGLGAIMRPEGFILDQGVAYNDALAAFRYYLENDNNGRGFVLIGHSQGAFILTRLVAEEIDGKPVQERLVSALLIGAAPTVATGRDVGGSFRSIPLCRSAAQTGCVIAYSAFRSTALPPANSLFGRPPSAGMTVACTNPAALAGGSGSLNAHMSTAGITISGPRPATPWVAGGGAITTPFVSVPGLLSAECTTTENATFLQVTVNGNPSDPRTDNIGGDLTPQWGLHLVDMNVAMGDLISIVRQQGAAFQGGR
jgi:pimeloyl-ACP methyl ester carboxylesterase